MKILGIFITFLCLSTAAFSQTNSSAVATNDPAEQAYHKILDDDDAALADIAQWIKDENLTNSAPPTNGALALRIQNRLAPVRKEYEDFLKEHPNHSRAHIAFGSFLSDVEEEDAARAEFELAVKLDPDNPAAWNDLANLLGHTGPVTNMFQYYDKAISLNPNEPVYYENLATCVYLYRKDAKEYYKLTNDAQVFERSLELYRKAMRLDPGNFALATEFAQTYYGVVPTRTDEALAAWTNALKLASTPLEQQGIYIHLARFKLAAGRFAEARAEIDKVSDPALNELKNRLLLNLAAQERPEKQNQPVLRMTCPSGRTCSLSQFPLRLFG